MENKIAWEKYPEGNKREEVFQFAENYRKLISASDVYKRQELPQVYF